MHVSPSTTESNLRHTRKRKAPSNKNLSFEGVNTQGFTCCVSEPGHAAQGVPGAHGQELHLPHLLLPDLVIAVRNKVFPENQTKQKIST